MAKRKVAETSTQELSDEQMREALVRKQQERVNEASEAIKSVCELYKVSIVPQATLTQGSVSMSLQIVPTE